jgi:hypothetical protein
MKRTIYLFLLAGIFFSSCASDPCKDKTVSHQVRIYKTVQKMDSIKAGDTAVIELNGRSYQVTNVETPLETEEPVAGKSTTPKVATPNKPCDSEFFDGSDRMAAKTSVVKGKPKTYNTLADFISTLPADAEMGALNIPTGPTSNRVAKEKHNVHILKAYIYAYSRESDEDYHVILGTTDHKSTSKFFNMEVSGLPPETSTAYDVLKSVRDAFTSYLKIDKCISGYRLFTDKPREVEVTGSIFFDVLHYTNHATIGPDGCRPASYWEIHPATEIIFK